VEERKNSARTGPEISEQKNRASKQSNKSEATIDIGRVQTSQHHVPVRNLIIVLLTEKDEDITK
jgi:hypothetical protein